MPESVKLPRPNHLRPVCSYLELLRESAQLEETPNTDELRY